jgi:branched-chain amino acid transport system ATP-binding protein
LKAKVIAVLGRNGAGKTILARTIMGFIPTRAGRITLAGCTITTAPAWRILQQGIAIVP